MSKIKQYILLANQILESRRQGIYSDMEDKLIDEMERIWISMTESEMEEINTRFAAFARTGEL